MNENLRWKLVLGCALIAVLEIPQGLSLLLQDFDGPYPRTAVSAPHSASMSSELIPVERTDHGALALLTLVKPSLGSVPVWSDLGAPRTELIHGNNRARASDR